MLAGPRLRGQFHELTVSSVERLCADAVAVTFGVPADLAEEYAFRAGQSLTLRRMIDGRQERRSYSICAPEGAPPRIGVREVPGGLFSSWLVHEVRPGTRIEVGTPAGTFSPAPGEAGRHVMIAAGSGITPVLSVAATVLREPDATVALLYGNRSARTVMFADELADLKDRYRDRLVLVNVLSREPREPELLSGRLDTAKLASLLALIPAPGQVDHWWLCGPYGMVAGAQAALAGAGVPAPRIHRELFYVDEAPPAPLRTDRTAPAGPASAVTITLDGRSTTVAVPAGERILDTVQRVRPDLPFACKGGMCGTCRASLVSGEVSMARNYALLEEEVAAGFVLTCQSTPQTPEVSLNFDV